MVLVSISGWTRKVTIRANEFDRNKCDVYYYPPKGTRIRSSKEMEVFRKYYPF